MDALLFFTFAGIAVLCAINLVLQTHPISSALSLVGVMGSLAVLYLLLGGAFIAAVQLIVYAGAVMVLFAFVIMLLNAGAESKAKKPAVRLWISVPLLFTFLILLASLIASRAPAGVAVRFGDFTGGTAANIGRALFTTYLLPFEVTSILILIAILGAVVLARKEI
ncbi:MAG TPA: NADH-quinone oxidoreductase subunit J [Bryobacteraceae bacterium]|nr:NADH-quinone oxidoreductase subunit J [Bryobacteraceae bacterium]